MNEKNSEDQMSARNEIQIAIMTEKVSNIEKNVGDIKTSIHDLTKSIDSNYASKAELSGTQRSVSKLEDNQKWLVRLVIGAIVTAILGAIGLNYR